MGKIVEYLAYGTAIRSDLELPGLTPGSDASAGRVDVVMGDVPSPPGDGSWTSLAPERCVLALEGVGRFEITAGERIVVEPLTADLRHVAHYVLGSAMGLLLGQRGLFPLHASAVDVDGGAVAIAGLSGAGKSTLGHELSRRGHPLLSDDIAALEFGDRVTRVHPARCGLRLNPDAVQVAGLESAGLPRLHGESDKSLVWPAGPPPRSSGSVSLARVYVLRPGRRVLVDEVEGAARALFLMANVHSPELATGAFGSRALFDACLRLAPTVRLFTLERPPGFDQMDELVGRVLDAG